MDPDPDPADATPARTTGRWLLAGFLAVAGVGHFLAREAFEAQVPEFLPGPTAIILISGVVELVLAAALVGLPARRAQVGWMVAAFFVAVLPGNLTQAVTGDPAFGLDTPGARWGRVLLQPLLVLCALWSTGAWSAWRRPR